MIVGLHVFNIFPRYYGVNGCTDYSFYQRRALSSYGLRDLSYRPPLWRSVSAHIPQPISLPSHTYGAVVLVVLSLWVENSGLLKAGPRQAEFEPIQAKTYRFSDVHGVDEAKSVCRHASC